MQIFLVKNKFLILSLTTFLLGYTYLVRYWFYYSKFQLNSDAFVPDALANSILSHGSIMPKEFAFANGDFLFYYHHTFLVFLNSIVPSPAMAHNYSSLIIGTIFLFTIFLFIRQLGASLIRSFLILSLVSTGISIQITDWLFGQAGYSVLITFILLFLTGLLKVISDFNLNGNTRFRFTRMLFLVFPLGALFLANPIRFMTVIGMPLSFAVLAILPSLTSLNGLWLKFFKQNILFASLIFVPFGVFRILFELRGNSVGGIMNTAFRDYSNILDGPENVLLGAVKLFDLIPDPATPLISLGSVIFLIKLLTLILFVLVVRKLFSNKESMSSQKFLLFFALFSFYIQIVLLIFTSVSIDIYCGRYILPSLFLIFLIVLSRFDFKNSINLRFFKLLALVLLVAFGISSIYSTVSLDRNDYLNRIQLIERLDNLGIKEVNATYWHSARNQNLADNQILFNTVYLDSSSCFSEYWWVNDKKSINRSLPLVLQKEEYSFLTSTSDCKSFLADRGIEEVSNYFILSRN